MNALRSVTRTLGELVHYVSKRTENKARKIYPSQNKQLGSETSSDICEDEVELAYRVHKEMPKLKNTMHLFIDTSYSYFEDDGSYSCMSIGIHSQCQSEYSRSAASLGDMFHYPKSCYNGGCVEVEEEYLETTAVSFCSPTEMDSSVPSSPCNQTDCTPSNKEVYPSTPACSPVAGLSRKPVPKAVQCGLYRGMFGTRTAAGAVAPVAAVKKDALMMISS